MEPISEPLLEAALELIKRINYCFLFDEPHTAGLDFADIKSALMSDGDLTPGIGSNIENLAEAMLRFRQATGDAAKEHLDPCAIERELKQSSQKGGQS